MRCVTTFSQGNSASAIPVPSSLLGIGGPAAHIAAMHSFMIHPQGIPQPLASPNSGVPQFGSFQSQPTVQPNLHWPTQQVITFLKYFKHCNIECQF